MVTSFGRLGGGGGGGRRHQPPLLPQRRTRHGGGGGFSIKTIFSSPRKRFRLIIATLALIALFPPIFFHFRLRCFHQMQLRKCGWINNPPLVCAHGGDTINAFPNTMAAYDSALSSHVDCIEIDVSRSSDGVLFALHDRDLQRISKGNNSKVGHLSMEEIKELKVPSQSQDFLNQTILTIEDALAMVSSSLRQVILDAKVGPPSYEKGLAKDILSIVEKAGCKNCLVWAKSDSLARDVINLAQDVPVGYIVMVDPKTGTQTSLLRMEGAGVVGIYHPLIDEKVVRTLHGRRKKVYAWTVDDVDSLQTMLYEHVDAIVTNNAKLLQRIMQDIRTQCKEDGFSLRP